MNTAPVREGICALVASFRPGAGFESHCRELLAQFRFLVVVDDGSPCSPLPTTSPLHSVPGFRMVYHAQNRGLAAALNTGLVAARELGCSWVVLLDQDTVPYPNLLQGLLDTWHQCPGPRIIVGANYWNSHRARAYLRRKTGAPPIPRKTLITAGTLLPIAITDEIGNFREDYVIDSVDHEFSLRARRAGWQLFMTSAVLCHQSIGGDGRRQNPFASFDHSPLRKYYIARNTVFTARLYARGEPTWALRQAWRLCGDLVSLLFFERERGRRLRAFLGGLRDGLAGRLGPASRTW